MSCLPNDRQRDNLVESNTIQRICLFLIESAQFQSSIKCIVQKGEIILFWSCN